MDKYANAMWAGFADELGEINGYGDLEKQALFERLMSLGAKAAPEAAQAVKATSKILPGTLAKLSPEARAAAQAAGRVAGHAPAGATAPARGLFTAGIKQPSAAEIAAGKARHFAKETAPGWAPTGAKPAELRL